MWRGTEAIATGAFFEPRSAAHDNRCPHDPNRHLASASRDCYRRLGRDLILEATARTNSADLVAPHPPINERSGGPRNRQARIEALCPAHV